MYLTDYSLNQNFRQSNIIENIALVDIPYAYINEADFGNPQDFNQEPMDPNRMPSDPNQNDQDQMFDADGNNVNNGNPNAQPVNGAQPGVEEVVEFEKIKQFILYERIKNIKQFLVLQDANEDCEKIIEFITIVLTFFSSFSYKDVVAIVDMIIESISEKLKIKVPSRLENL